MQMSPLNTNELLQRMGFQELVCVSSCDYLMKTLKWQKLFCLYC